MKKFVSGKNKDQALVNQLKKYPLYNLLENISTESARLLNLHDDERIVFGVAHEEFEVQQMYTGRKEKIPTYITGWGLVDLAYQAILATNDYRGKRIDDRTELLVLLCLSWNSSGEVDEKILSQLGENDPMLFVWGFAGEQMKFQHPGKIIDTMNREIYLIVEIAKRIGSDIDAERIVVDETGLGLYKILSAIYLLWFGSTTTPQINEIKKRINWSKELTKSDFEKVVDFYSITYKEIRDSSLGRQILYANPLVKTDKSGCICINTFLLFFLYEHCIFWIIRNHYHKLKSQDFTNVFGVLFECYFEELLNEYLTPQDFEKIPETGVKRADWKIEIGKYRFLIEQKSALIHISAKQQQSNVEDLKAFINRNIIKAINQLNQTEVDFGDGKYIKIILIYEDYLNGESINYIFNMDECEVESDHNYWIITLDEIEKLLFLYKNDYKAFSDIIDEKIQLEEMVSKHGRSIDGLLEKRGVRKNEHLQQVRFTAYHNKARSMVELCLNS